MPIMPWPNCRAGLQLRLGEFDATAPGAAFSVHMLPNDQYMYLKTPPDAQTKSCICTKDCRAPKRCSWTPDKFNTADTRYNITYFVPSPDNQRIAYALAANGPKKPTLHILDVATRQDLQEIIDRMDWE